ncbi:MAG TPA: hypothetical protein VGZ24_02120 [Chthoniobacterales bacterium]|jgi:hypothetical protein|nr:hypothetical protein [Chthoniobacterales bacterium]
MVNASPEDAQGAPQMARKNNARTLGEIQVADSIFRGVKRYRLHSNQTQHVYEVRPRKDKRGVDLISNVLPFGGLWCGEPNAISNAIGNAKFHSRPHSVVIRVFDESGTVIETHVHGGIFQHHLIE